MLEVPLKEAASLCKKSEKTLRRKIEAGLLGGRKEPLEFGGFMWMINIDSLDELYPGSRPSNLPQVYDAPEPPQTRLKNRKEDEKKDSEDTAIVIHPTSEDGSESDEDLMDMDEDGEEWNAKQSFFDYILEENRDLKSELKNKEARIFNLNERAFVLERALGEQEGTSTTQARVLEWFQTQESAREKKRQEQDEKLLVAAPEAKERDVTRVFTAALGGAAAVLLFLFVLFSTGVLNFTA